MRLKWIVELKEANIIQGAKVDREKNLSDILTHCQAMPAEWEVHESSATNRTTSQKVLRTEKLPRYLEEPIGIHIAELLGESPIQELIT